MEQSEKSKFLGEAKISKLLLKFSVPCILSLLISALYNIVDQIFIGNSALGYLGNAATGIVFPIMIVAQAFAWCIGDGCAAYLSICQGKRIRRIPISVLVRVSLSHLSSVFCSWRRASFFGSRCSACLAHLTRPSTWRLPI